MLSARTSKAVVFTEFLPTLDHLARVRQHHGKQHLRVIAKLAQWPRPF